MDGKLKTHNSYTTIPNVAHFLLTAERMREHNMKCLNNCLEKEHLVDDGVKGIERYCIGGCMSARFTNIQTAAVVPPQLKNAYKGSKDITVSLH